MWDDFVAWDVMALPALQKFEQQIGRQMRLLELRKNIIERKIERQIRLFEQKRDGIGKKIEAQVRQFEAKRGIGSTTRCVSSAPGSNGRCRSAR